MPAKRKILATSAFNLCKWYASFRHLVGTIQGDIWTRLQKMLGRLLIYLW